MEKRKCTQCGKEFTISDSEKSFFENRNLKLPKRCKECREMNKQRQRNTDTFQVPLKKESIFTAKKAVLLLSILVIAVTIVYFNREIGSKLNSVFDFGSDINSEANSDPNSSRETNSKPDSNNKNSSDKSQATQETDTSVSYTFKNESLLQEHFQKHGGDFGYESASQYESGASAVINSPEALHKTEAVDGDSVYYIEATNEFVILSTEGYIRTYFKPEDGLDYYNRQ